jgi:hypothetical protein
VPGTGTGRQILPAVLGPFGSIGMPPPAFLCEVSDIPVLVLPLVSQRPALHNWEKTQARVARRLAVARPEQSFTRKWGAS